jgi:hypothetical protein
VPPEGGFAEKKFSSQSKQVGFLIRRSLERKISDRDRIYLPTARKYTLGIACQNCETFFVTIKVQVFTVYPLGLAGIVCLATAAQIDSLSVLALVTREDS